MNRNATSFTTLMALALLAGCSRQAPAPAAEAAAEPTPVAEAPAPVEAPPADERMVVSAGVAKAGTDDGTLQVVPYADLGQHVGERIEFTSTMGSVRHGTVLSSNAYETQIRLDAADGGFQLAVPAETVAQIRLMPARDAAGSTAAPAR